MKQYRVKSAGPAPNGEIELHLVLPESGKVAAVAVAPSRLLEDIIEQAAAHGGPPR